MNHRNSSRPARIVSLASRSAVALALIAVVSIVAAPEARADGAITLYRAESACETVRDYGVGLQGSGAGTIDIAEGPGEVRAAFLEWAGYDDVTPDDIARGGDRADSTLVINGVDVVGVQPAGDAGYAPSGLPDDWYAWYADVGPTGMGLISDGGAMTLDVSGYDSPGPRYNNGASLVIIYDVSPCTETRLIEVRTGIDYYWEGLPDGGGFTAPLVYEFAPAPVDRTAQFYLNHAGTDFTQTTCRGDALWLAAGTGVAPTQIATNDGRGTAAYGLNGGVEGIDDPFGGGSLPCTVELNPVPDIAPPPDHPYPGGAAEAPYRVVDFDRFSEPEWNSVRVDVLIPADATWVVFQMESESDQDGESGATVGGGPFVLGTPAIIGDNEIPADIELTKGVAASAEGPFVDAITVDVPATVWWQLIATSRAETPEGDPLADITGAVVTDVLPDGLMFVTASGDGSYDAASGSWVIGDLAKGTTVTLLIETTVEATGTIVNLAEVTGHDQPDIDSTPDNGPQQPPEDDEDSARVDSAIVDVELTKLVDGVDGPVDRVRGQEIVYTVQVRADDVTDDGRALSDVTGLVVTDVLPSDVTFVAASGAGEYDPATGRWSIGDLAAGATVSIDLTVRINADALLEFANFAEVSEHDQPDIDSTPDNGPQTPSEDDEDEVIVKVPTVEGDTETPGGTPGGDTIPATGAESAALWFVGLLVLALGADLLVMSVSVGRLEAIRARRTPRG